MQKQLLSLIIALSFSSTVIAKSYYEDALKAYEQNDIDASYVHLKNALQKNQDNLPAKILMGHVLLRKGLYYDGVEEFKDALAMKADPNPFVYEMARAQLFNKEYNQVIELTKLANISEDNRIKILLTASNAYLALTKPKLALEMLEQAFALAPEQLNTNTSLAAYYLEQRLFSQGQHYLDKALSLAPNNSRIWQLQGEFFNAQGRGLQALTAFEKAYEVDAKDPVVMRSLANQYANLNKLDTALSFVNTILAETPFDTYTELLKARLLIRNGQAEQAQIILERISSQLSLLTDVQKSADPSIAYVSGSAAFLLGNYEQAQQDLIYYVNEKPEDLSGINMLVDIYQSQHQQEKVEALLERYEPRIKKDLFLALNLYNIYLKNNKTYKAKSLLDELERLYSNNLLVIMARANYLVATNRTPEAISLLNANIPSQFNGSYELNRGNLYLSIDDFDNAHKIANLLLEQNKSNSQYLIFKGVLLSKQLNFNEAIGYFDQVLAISSEHFPALMNKASALAATGKQQNAMEIIKPLASTYPDHLGLQVFFAKLSRDLGEPNKAIEKLTGLLKVKPRYLPASEVLFNIYFDQGSYELALEESERLNSNSFLHPTYIGYKAKTLIKLNKIEEANIQLGKLLGLAKTAQDYYQLSTMQTMAGNFNAALSNLDDALKQQADSFILNVEKAKLLLTLNKPKESRVILNQLSKQHNRNPNLKYAYGLYYSQINDLTNAYKAFEQAFELDNNFVAAAFKLYALAQQNIQTKRFISHMEKLVVKQPEHAVISNLLADLYLIQGEKNKALAHYLAIEDKRIISPSSVFNNIAYIYATTKTENSAEPKELDIALSYAEKAIAIAPNSSAFLDTYGWILALKGEYSQSLEKLRQAYAIDANNPAICYHLALTLEKMGRIDEAKIELEKALAMNVDFSEKEQTKALLKKLSS